MAAEDDSDIPDTGAVFTFGKSKFADNLPNKFWVRNDQVLEVACGDEHTALVAESGRVFTFGSNDWGQLGLGSTKTADRPSCIKSLKSEKVKLVACGRSHTIVATESGKLYSFGANGEGQLGVQDDPASNVPKCIDSLITQQYSMLTAGADHTVALTEDGAVFVWGSNSEGQIGLVGKSETQEPEELPIEDVVTCVACGYYHTAIVTESGDLYTFGESEGGKLGLGDDPEETATPQKVTMPEKVKAVSCGGSHTVVITESGSVYSFGEGPNGQLGHGTHCLQSSTPRKLKIGFKARALDCGENHTAIISEKGQMYTFGDGRHGKLALGQDCFSNQFVPSKVDRFSKFNVGKVSCGGCHMISLAKLRPETNDTAPSSEEEETAEPKVNGVLNHMLKSDGSMDLNLSITARDRRRKHNDSFKNDLNRTLPPLAGAQKIPPEHLHLTVPAVKSRRLEPSPLTQQVNNNRAEDSSKSGEEEVEEETVKAESKHALEAAPKPLPRPVPRKQPDPHRAESEDSEEESEEEEEVTEETAQSPRLLPQAPIPPPRAQARTTVESAGEEADSEEDKEEEPKTKGKKDKKKKKKEKRKGIGLFGRKKTGLSDEEEEEEEEEETDKKEEVKEKSEEEEEEKEDKKSKKGKKDKKDKKKDKKDKKDKKGKDKKKDEEDEDEEEEKEDDDEEEEDGKDKKKNKKDKKKDKDKKKNDKKKGKKDKDDEEEEEDEEKDEEEDSKKKDKKKDKKEKDKKKDKKDKDKDEDKDKADEEENKSDEGEKDGEKPPEPPKKKSRTCTIL